ncbi:DUF7220 family protein [Pseudorhodoplanes sp.]|uniref:DUF7220 family protein n=1 Tax=Pseudorhodoplanes sp. TaxID=1934341 RepID=UPI003D1121D2
MKQSRLMSLVESLINIAVGLGVAMVANAIILPVLGFPITLAQNVMIAAFMTVVSIARSYVLRRLFEALHIRHPLSPGALAIVAERRRQIEAEGWTPEHDLAHAPGELAKAGASYALSLTERGDLPPVTWPWSADWWKPTDHRRNLVKAGALILAELDRADHARKRGFR